MKLDQSFYAQDVLDVAPALIGARLCRHHADGRVERYTICETEAYRGQEDLACHASKGRTPRTEVMYAPGGTIYMYLIYGMYWMLNFVTGPAGHPQAVLIRGLDKVSGPGRLTRELGLDKSFLHQDICTSGLLWTEKHLSGQLAIKTTPRIGIDYAGEHWAGKHWRFILDQDA